MAGLAKEDLVYDVFLSYIYDLLDQPQVDMCTAAEPQSTGGKLV